MIRLDILRFTAQQYRQRRKVSFILFLISNLWLFSVLLYFQKPVFYLFCLLGTSVALGARLRKLQKERILVENINSQSIFGRPHRVNHHLDFEAGFADENMAERLPTDRELAAFPRFLLTDNPGELSDASTRTPATDSTSLSDVQAPRERPDLHIPDEWEGEQDPAHRFIGGLPNQRRFIRPGQLYRLVELYERRLDRILAGADRDAAGLKEVDLVHLPVSRFDEASRQEDSHDCAICYRTYEAEEQVRTLHCGHFYHISCVDPWLLKKNSCPICKKRATKD